MVARNLRSLTAVSVSALLAARPVWALPQHSLTRIPWRADERGGTVLFRFGREGEPRRGASAVPMDLPAASVNPLASSPQESERLAWASAVQSAVEAGAQSVAAAELAPTSRAFAARPFPPTPPKPAVSIGDAVAAAAQSPLVGVIAVAELLIDAVDPAQSATRKLRRARALDKVPAVYEAPGRSSAEEGATAQARGQATGGSPSFLGVALAAAASAAAALALGGIAFLRAFFTARDTPGAKQ